MVRTEKLESSQRGAKGCQGEAWIAIVDQGCVLTGGWRVGLYCFKKPALAIKHPALPRLLLQYSTNCRQAEVS
jgi:hypothetical protein